MNIAVSPHYSATGNTLLSRGHQPFETQHMPASSIVGGSSERNTVFGSSTNFEFAIEAEKMVSELCNSSTKRDNFPEHRRAAMCPSDTNGRHIAPNPEREMCFRDLVIKGCLELENILKAHKRNVYIGDLLSFCRTIRESARNPVGFDLDKPCDETRARIIAFFRLASCWLGVYPCLGSSLPFPGPGSNPLHAAFREWQAASRRLIVAILQSVPLLSAQDAHPKPQPKQKKFAESGNKSDFKIWNSRNTVNHFQDSNSYHKWTISPPETSDKQNSFQNEYSSATSLKIGAPQKYATSYLSNSECDKRSRAATPFCDAARVNSLTVCGEDSKIQNFKVHRSDKWKVQRENPPHSQKEAPKFSLAPGNERSSTVEADKFFHGYNHASADSFSPIDTICPVVHTPPTTKESSSRHHSIPPPRYTCNDIRQTNSNGHNNMPTKGRKWYNSREKRQVVTPAMYDGDSSDDLHDGAYMKPGSYEVPKRQEGAGCTSQDNAWRAALASAETLCKALETDQWLAQFAQFQPHTNGTDADATTQPALSSSVETIKRNGDLDAKEIVVSLDGHAVNKTPRSIQVRAEEAAAAAGHKTADKRAKPRARTGARSTRTLARAGRSRSISLSPPGSGAPHQASVQSPLGVPVQTQLQSPLKTQRQSPLQAQLQSHQLQSQLQNHQLQSPLQTQHQSPLQTHQIQTQLQSPLQTHQLQTQLQSPLHAQFQSALHTHQLQSPLQTQLQSSLQAALQPLQAALQSARECPLQASLQTVLDAVWSLDEARCVKYTRSEDTLCLSTMAQKLMNTGYDSVDQFVDDFRVVLQARVTTGNAGAAKVLEEKFYQLLDLTLKNSDFRKDYLDENSSILTSAASSEADVTETESLLASRPKE